ncbi:polyphosphate polymerase domain-containing protein [Candidatus Allofournierella merdipullorum]|uniref:polyphosphate polymerase domain-containing protein n=1 Tax=Candidatus Allofournierella merdipullorum TaxID=2838595 RepID=UPI003AB89E24
MYYRNEWKYLVTDADLVVLGARLKALLPSDSHQKGSAYAIRSLYFDDMSNSCLRENEAGVDDRKKYRLRLYNADPSRIRLEIKEKLHGKTHKSSCFVTDGECRGIMAGRRPAIGAETPAPQNLLSVAMASRGMAPRVIVEYERTAFVNRSGNVRITFDRNIGASNSLGAFLEPRVPLTPILPPGVHVLEVKFDEFLPDYVAQALELGRLRQTAFSKYYLSRLALPGPLAERAREYEF